MRKIFGNYGCFVENIKQGNHRKGKNSTGKEEIYKMSSRECAYIRHEHVCIRAKGSTMHIFFLLGFYWFYKTDVQLIFGFKTQEEFTFGSSLIHFIGTITVLSKISKCAKNLNKSYWSTLFTWPCAKLCLNTYNK